MLLNWLGADGGSRFGATVLNAIDNDKSGRLYDTIQPGIYRNGMIKVCTAGWRWRDNDRNYKTQLILLNDMALIMLESGPNIYCRKRKRCNNCEPIWDTEDNKNFFGICLNRR
jgi:hypothetical protein